MLGRTFLVAALALAVLLAGPSEAEAQRLHFHTYRTDAGLPQSQIVALHQDRSGYLWFGTYAGAGRYNGLRFRTYSSAIGLPGNVVNALAEDAQGRMVLAIGGGAVCLVEGIHLRCLEGEGEEHEGEDGGLAGPLGGSDVLHLATDAEGGIWMGGDAGLAVADSGGSVRWVLSANDPDGGRVAALATHPDGSVWVATASALLRRARGEERFRTVTALEEGEVRFLLPLPPPGPSPAQAAPGSVVAGTDRGLLVVAPSGERHPLTDAPHPSGVTFRGGSIDAGGTAWFASTAGLLRVEEGEGYWIGPAQGLPWSELNAVLVDREGNVWIGSDQGLARLVPGPFVRYGMEEGLPNPMVRALMRGPDGRIWAGTRQGVVAWEPDERAAGGSSSPQSGRFLPRVLPDALPDPRVYAMASQDDGSVLLGTADGLVHLDEGRITVHGRGTASPGGWVGSLLPAPDGSVWVATRQGVGRWAEGALTGFREGHPLAEVFAVSLLLDEAGRLWVGTASEGVLVASGAGWEEVRRLDADAGLTDQVVWDMALDGEGSVWVASNGDGLFRVRLGDPTSGAPDIEQWGARDGLPDPFLWQVHVDREGALWAYTGRGLVRRDPDGEVRRFGVADGLPTLEGAAASVLELDDGTLWFGTGEGAVVRLPIPPGRPPLPPPILIEEVWVDGSHLPHRDWQALGHGEGPEGGLRIRTRLLQVEVSSPTFQDPEGIRFRYRLLRGEREIIPWSVPSGDPSLTLAGLGAGSYSLEVTAITAGGVESEVPARLPFTIRPAFWQTPGFVVLAMVAFILLLAGLNRIRSGAMEEERKRLEGLVRARTAEIQDANDRLREEVAERERAEAALLESEGKLRDIIENSTNVFYAHTPQHEITYISPQCRQVFGHEPEIFPEVWTSLATDHPANERGITITERALETGERQPPYELQLRHADGHPIWVRVTEAPVVRNGRVVGMVGSLTDVTETRAAEEARHGLEERLREARKMEAVGRLAGGIAHDFNNLLTSIMGHTSLMAMDLPETHPLQHDLSEVAEACGRAAALVAQLLAVGRRQLMRPAPFHVHAALEERARMLSRLVGDTVEIFTEREGDDPKVVMDPSQFDQVVLNLVLNARDAMPTGGEIRLQVSTRGWASPPPGWEDPDFVPGDFAEIICADNGSGMPPEVVERIFEPFFTTKQVGEGTGLGLSTVWGIIRQNHGHLKVDSTPGLGTTFRIWIPANREEEGPGPAGEAGGTPSPRGGRTAPGEEDGEGKGEGDLRAGP